MERHQDGGAGRIDRQGWPMPIHGVGDASSRQITQIVGHDGRVGRFGCKELGAGKFFIDTLAQPHEDADPLTRQRFARIASVGDTVVAKFPREAVLRVNDCGFGRADVEEVGVKVIGFVDEDAPSGDFFPWLVGAGIVEA